MNQTSSIDLALLPASVPDGVVRTADLRASGVSGSAISVRCRPGGPWQRLLPGVVLLSSGSPTRRQQLRAALLYAGDGAVITGVDAACLRHELHLPIPEDVHVLVPATRRVAGEGFAITERTTRMPETITEDGLIYAPVARAVLDAARRERDAQRLRALLAEPVRCGACRVSDLREELDAGSQRGTAAPRAALRAVSDGVLSLAQGWARRIVRTCPIPPPRWNVPVRNASGILLGVVDAWWDEVALAWEVGTQDFRLGAGERSGSPRQSGLTGSGILVLRTARDRLRTDPAGVRRDLVQAFHRATRRIRPPVHGLADQLRSTPGR
ncbi:hypothetical protein GCM10010174_28390 [Kutzneria viridogrisea]|uniref:Uncharacterized protein n=2 Tax=Kutzneria TaxID=43356 RepID=W5W100_9PSEU|nr:hypothetical protein [Kutzneria albida]AHH94470.1 hypothetical protein KALB_1097 [Kutzneria albida DSM 43870]MBA8930138.1 hypothetical protein [Kutzneria viridogrisea]